MFNNNKKYLPKQKKAIFVRSCFLILATLFGFGSSYLVYYLIKLDNGTKISLNQISGPDKLDKKGDQIVYEAKVKNPKGVTTWKEPTPVDGVSFSYSNDGEHDLIIATALVDMQYEPSIDITAINNKKTASASIASSYVPFNALPVTSQYFRFAMTDNANDTIVGFSNAVLNDPSILVNSGCNSMDFTKNLDIKYVDASASFPEDILALWGVEKISFSGLKFKFKHFVDDAAFEYVTSGYQMFYNYNFLSLIELDLSYADFASAIEIDFPNKDTEAMIVTGYQMFQGCYFAKLHTLKLNDAIFASYEMQAPTSDPAKTTWGIYTGYEMFGDELTNRGDVNVSLEKLAVLDMSNAVFAAEGMGSGSALTAYSMFEGAAMNDLSALKLDGTVFAAKNVSKYTGSSPLSFGISTGYRTFACTQMANLKELNLSSTIFSTEKMFDEINANHSNNGQISTASWTFLGSELSGLETLDLSNVEFASKNNYGVNSYISAYQTFNDANLYSVTSLKLDNTKFAAENMLISDDSSSTVNSTYYLFQSADLSSLKTLDLSTAIFATENTASHNITTGEGMFSETKLNSLVELDLSNTTLLVPNMSQRGDTTFMAGMFAYYDPCPNSVKDIYLPSLISFDGTYQFDTTFDGFENAFPSIGTIHWPDYDYLNPSDRPRNNWYSSWFNNWTWTSN